MLTGWLLLFATKTSVATPRVSLFEPAASRRLHSEWRSTVHLSVFFEFDLEFTKPRSIEQLGCACSNTLLPDLNLPVLFEVFGEIWSLSSHGHLNSFLIVQIESDHNNIILGKRVALAASFIRAALFLLLYWTFQYLAILLDND